MGRENRKSPTDKNSEERDLWQKVTEGIRPLKGRERPQTATEPKEPKLPKEPPGRPPARKPASAEANSPQQGLPVGPAAPLPHRTGLNKRDAERLKRGKMQIDAYLDLHGMTLAQAHQRLRSFVIKSQAAGLRCLLVITGTGRTKEGGGALRRELPHWLAEPGLAGRVLGLEQAQPHHGGAGAYYLLLRRKRDE